MKVSPSVLLIAAVVLLAASLVLVLGVYGATPAHAQAGRTCVGVAATCSADRSQWAVYRAWSDGTIEARTTGATNLGLVGF